MVEIKNVSLKYNEKQIVLKNTNIDIKKGECILLCGESGCGKTTVTKLINGLIPHFEEQAEFSGEVVIAGVNTTGAELYQISQYVGSVFQNPKSQFFHSDTESEIVFGMENAGINPELIRKRLDETVEKLHLENMLGKSVFLMSGGEKQLLAFASVYAMGADIFVLDEPTANLDMEVIEILANMIRKCKEEGKTVIIAEHRLYFLTELIDRAIYMKSGKIEKWFDSTEFKALTEKERISMGLRTLIKPDFEKIVSDKGTKEKVGLEINNLTCVYGKNKVFADLNLSAYYGEVVGILGHNGAGKSTLVRCLCGLLKEKEGTISLCGRKMKPKERQKRSFLVMQDVNHQLFSDSVKNECLLSAPNESDERIDEILNSLDLLEFKDKHPMALSGGQKQRLAIATAILSEREILIFDEPTSGLDYGRMNVVSSIIKKIASSNRIILIVSHDFEFLNNVCDRAILIDADRR